MRAAIIPTRMTGWTPKRMTSRGMTVGASSATIKPPGKMASPVSMADQPRSCCI